MTRLHRLGFSRRVVVIVGLGVALLFIGAYVTSLGGTVYATGWTGYAPLSVAPLRAPGGLHPCVQLLVWLALVVVWVVGSLRILHRRELRSGDRGPVSTRAIDESEPAAGQR
jgi:heme/copper-type cytochrome/quinol oxidase subunit 1